MMVASPTFVAKDGYYPVTVAILLAVCLHGFVLVGGFYFSKNSSQEVEVLVNHKKDNTIVGVLVSDTNNKTPIKPKAEAVAKKSEAQESNKSVDIAPIQPEKMPLSTPKKQKVHDVKKTLEQPPQKLSIKKESSTNQSEELVQNVQESNPSNQQASSLKTSSVEAIKKTTVTEITKPIASAAHLNNAPPIYPRRSLRRKEEGTVVLLVFITQAGKVEKVRIKKTSGYERLDEAAIEAVRQWHYIPANQDNQAIDYWHEQLIVFNLRG